MLILNGTKIEIAQARKGIANQTLVNISGLSSQTINAIKKGGRCNAETVHAICKALECDPTDLIDEKE